MSRRNCTQEDLLSAYLDGELRGDALKHFEEHLASCRHCSVLHETMKSHHHLLMESLIDREPPAHLKAQLFRRIEAETESRQPAGFLGWTGIRLSFSSGFRSWAYACAPVVLLAIIVSAFQLQHRIENGRVLAAIDRSKAEFVARDNAPNPFNIDVNGSPLRFAGKNPFEAYLNER